MSGGGINFQTPTALYSSIAGQPGYGTLFPAAGLGWPGTQTTGKGSPFYNALSGINNTYSPGDTGSSSVLTSLPGYASQALQSGFDPQNALFNKLFQQQQDQSNATNAMSGVATTPYGAALTQQGNQNFDLAWQQQQLARQQQGANTAEGLLGTGLGAQQQQIQDYLNYIMSNVQEGSAITSGTNSATNAGANSTNALANASQANNAGKGGIGSALGGIGSLAGKFASGGKG